MILNDQLLIFLTRRQYLMILMDHLLVLHHCIREKPKILKDHKIPQEHLGDSEETEMELNPINDQQEQIELKFKIHECKRTIIS